MFESFKGKEITKEKVLINFYLSWKTTVFAIRDVAWLLQ